MTDRITTELPVKSLPAGVRAALTHFAHKRATVRVEGRETCCPISYAHSHKIAKCAVLVGFCFFDVPVT